jgi:uncharacterized protein YdgA (DUF945 family)
VRRRVLTIIIVLLTVAGLWGGTTYWFGVKAEQQYGVMLQQASQIQVLKFVNESYSRGFSDSKARTVVEIQLPLGTAAENRPLQAILVHNITHGPFPLGKSADTKGPFRPVMALIETSIIFSPEAQSRLAELWTQIPEIASMRDSTVIYLDGSGEERLFIPAFQRTFGNQEKVAVDWKGLSFQADFTADLRAFKGSVGVPGVAVSGKDFDVRIENLRSAFNTHESLSGLWLGEASFALAGLDFTSKLEPKSQSMFLRGFNVNTSSKASGDVINSSVAVRTEQLKLDEVQTGPGVLEMEFRNLDATSLARLQQAIREEHARPRQQSAEAGKAMAFVRYMEILSGLLKKSPEIEVTKLDVKTALGDFTGKAKIAFDGTKLESSPNLLTLALALSAQAECAAGEDLLRSMATAIMKDQIIGEFQEPDGTAPSDTEVDEIASARVDEQLEELMAQGILVRENGNYKASASYQAGQMVLNGRPLSLQNLLQ